MQRSIELVRNPELRASLVSSKGLKMFLFSRILQIYTIFFDNIKAVLNVDGLEYFCIS